ncbi:MAG: hypothetical protein ACFE0R_13655 [Salinarimonas sp.]
MLLNLSLTQPERSLDQLLANSDVFDDQVSFGDDIDRAHEVLLDETRSHQERCDRFLEWASRYQPCLFGRLGARKTMNISYDICWIDEQEVRNGDTYLIKKIRAARRAWKIRASEGLSSGFLIMFNGPRFAHLKPGQDLLDVCMQISNLYLVENAPVEADVIYTEAVPLRLQSLQLFRGGINLFYPSAHRTRNHDRRVPGGVLVSVNSPGHWANTLVKHNLVEGLGEAVDRAMDLALRSIGNGGIGHPGFPSATWHNRETDPAALAARRCVGRLPHTVPADHSQATYSGLYHTDVLVPTEVTVDGTIDPDFGACEHWRHLVLGYISEATVAEGHLNYALIHGHPIAEEEIFHNPWAPRRAVNAPSFL